MKRFLAALLVMLLVAPAPAQVIGPPSDPNAFEAPPPGIQRTRELLGLDAPGDINPLQVLSVVGDALPSRSVSRGEEAPGGLSAAINIMLLLTVISLAPSIMLMTTCFVRILIVLGLLRQAIGMQTLPPAQMVTAIALFMTLMVMSPTIDRIWNEAVVPYRAGEVHTYDDLWERAVQPLRDYMFDQIEATGNWSSLYMVLNYRGRLDTSDPSALTRGDVELVELVPAYMLSELKTAFTMGFRVYLPFLIIDMVIASLLISMSMMMLPPVLISLPFKLLLFVLVDGWQLIVGSLMTSFVQEGMSPRMSEKAAEISAAIPMHIPPEVLALPVHAPGGILPV